MREKKLPTPKQEKKAPRKKPSKQEKKPSMAESHPSPEENKPSTDESKPSTEVKIEQPTKEEIEAIKEDILAHGLFNPYALILYNYMRISDYETNIQVVISMRQSLLKIAKINEIILEELKENDEQ
jgi:hypothetical protein